MGNQNITFLKTQNFLRTYPNILFFQHNNLSVNQWFNLRVQLKKSENVEVLVLKNSIMNHVFVDSILTEKENFPSLFQGPCFAIGFLDSSRFQDILKTTLKGSSTFLLGGILNKKCINHLDVSKILQIDEKIHDVFLRNLNQGTQLDTLLTNSISNSYLQLNQISLNFLNCLEFIKFNKSTKVLSMYIIRSQSNRRFPYGYLVTTSLQLLPIFWDFFRSPL